MAGLKPCPSENLLVSCPTYQHIPTINFVIPQRVTTVERESAFGGVRLQPHHQCSRWQAALAAEVDSGVRWRVALTTEIDRTASVRRGFSR